MWFLNRINREQAIEALDAIARASAELIVKTDSKLCYPFPIREKESWPFRPKGAIIHASKTRSIESAIAHEVTHVTKSHFIVMATKDSRDRLGREGILAEFPTTIVMPHDWRSAIMHSGWMSPATWGIELRSVGRLRPFKPGKEPPPLLHQEETFERFHDTKELLSDGTDVSLYWLHNGWRSPWPGPAINWNGSYFETPGENQMVSLIGLLRLLACAGGEAFDGRYILPSHLVSGTPPELPSLKLPRLRSLATCYVDEGSDQLEAVELERDDLAFYWSGRRPLDTTARQIKGWNETNPVSGEDIEAFELSLKTDWRHVRDMGQSRRYQMARDLKLDRAMSARLGDYGFDIQHPAFILELHGIGHELEDATDEALASSLLASLSRDGYPKRP